MMAEESAYKCCGINADTPFCPFCGRHLRSADPLDTLLGHCRSNADRAEQAVDELAKLNPGDEDSVRGIKFRKRTLAKWQGWAEAIERVLNERQAAKEVSP